MKSGNAASASGILRTALHAYYLIRWPSKKRKKAKARADAKLLVSLPGKTALGLLPYLHLSKSQLRQDLFALSQVGLKRGGFFVEFGATNGVDLSNTHLLETQFGWSGILAEPARCWHEQLHKNRNCAIETACVWRDSSSVLTFNEVAEPELSTINEYSRIDGHEKSRAQGTHYEVPTISLADLLEKHDAPATIDYLSIDTEGSEYEILQHFDFDRYRFRCITIEHNFTPARELIHRLLTSHGYRRMFEELSEFDDWYVAAGPDQS